jgi:hypothetical protein
MHTQCKNRFSRKVGLPAVEAVVKQALDNAAWQDGNWGYDGLVTLREQLEERNRQWRLFHEWDAGQQSVDRSPEAILADLSWLLQWIPADVVRSDPDPEKHGIAKMRAALALLSER